MKKFMLSLSLLACVSVGGVAQADEGLPTAALRQSEAAPESLERPRYPLRRNVCVARNARNRVFRGMGFNRFMARRNAINNCQQGSLFFLRRTCRVLYCR